MINFWAQLSAITIINCVVPGPACRKRSEYLMMFSISTPVRCFDTSFLTHWAAGFQAMSVENGAGG